MNWAALGSFIGGIISAIGDKLFGPKAPPEPPAPAPEPPKMGEIDAKIDEMLGRLEAEDAQAAAAERLKEAARARAASEPATILPPRTPVPSDASERAGDVDAMAGNAPTIDDPPTVRKP